MGRVYGYARVSTIDQDLTIQRESLEKVGCIVIKYEKQSGTTIQNREALSTLLEFIDKDDVLVVTRLDRLGRSVIDLHLIVEKLQSKGANLRVLEQSVDTTTSEGKAFFGMLSVFSEFETGLRRERQLEGIEKAKKQGKYLGRKSEIDLARIIELKVLGMGVSSIARKLGICRSSVYRLLKDSNGS